MTADARRPDPSAYQTCAGDPSADAGRRPGSLTFAVSHDDPTQPPPPLGLTSERFADIYSGVASAPAPDGRRLGGRLGALAAYKRLFREGVEIEGLPSGLAPIAAVLEEPCAEGTLRKFTQRVPGVPGRFDELTTESVLIPMVGRTGRRTHTLCVSSQIGCAMGCTFCETAQMGLIRHLTPAEIVGQWFAATHGLREQVANIVFMGMGEPMDNLDHVLDAIAVLKDHNGAAMPVSRITISTVGRIDGIRRLREKLHEPGWHRLNLAISLNAPNDAVRDGLMPVNRKYRLAELQAELLQWPRYGGSKLCVEYVLIPGVNDAAEHAAEVASFLEPINRAHALAGGTTPRAMVNLIPYNPRRQSPWPAPTEESVDAFLRRLGDLGVYVKRRRTKGRQLMGACGQLGSESIRRRQVVPLGVRAE